MAAVGLPPSRRPTGRLVVTRDIGTQVDPRVLTAEVATQTRSDSRLYGQWKTLVLRLWCSFWRDCKGREHLLCWYRSVLWALFRANQRCLARYLRARDRYLVAWRSTSSAWDLLDCWVTLSESYPRRERHYQQAMERVAQLCFQQERVTALRLLA